MLVWFLGCLMRRPECGSIAYVPGIDLALSNGIASFARFGMSF